MMARDDLAQTPKPTQAISERVGRRRQGTLGPILGGLLRERQGINAQEQGTPIVRGLPRHDEGQLVFGAKPAFTRPLAAQIGIVDLDPPGPLPIRLPLRHHLESMRKLFRACEREFFLMFEILTYLYPYTTGMRRRSNVHPLA